MWGRGGEWLNGGGPQKREGVNREIIAILKFTKLNC